MTWCSGPPPSLRWEKNLKDQCKLIERRQEWSRGGRKWGKKETPEWIEEEEEEEGKNAEPGSSCWGFPPLMYSLHPPPPFFFFLAQP